MIHRLLVPGLLEGPPDGVDRAGLPRFPLLERFLARADEGRAEGDLEALVTGFYGLPPGQGAAPFCYLADTGRRPESGVLRAFPVHLRADRDRVLLFPLDETLLDREEARDLANGFNSHFADEGLRLEVARPHRWYLLTERLPATPLASLGQVAGRSLRDFLPDRDRFWLSVINETQMLFFNSPVNQARERAGRLPVNGLWFDGRGSLPGVPLRGPGRGEGDHCLLRGLVACTTEDNGERVTVMEDIHQALREQNASAWLQARYGLESRLHGMIHDAEIMLYSCDGRSWHWKPSCNRRFWRFPRPLPWS
ncbi:hypothetical protein [Thiolapillus sp.]